jgi:hypothetical protein
MRKRDFLFSLLVFFSLALRSASAGTVVSSGSGTLRGTWCFDFDSGGETDCTTPSDVWWDIIDINHIYRQMVPGGAPGNVSSATVVNLGVVDFDPITPAYLSSLTYGTTPIVGNNDSTNHLVDGDVFAVHTHSGNYAKVKILQYGYDLLLQWVTMSPGSNEGSPSPVLAFRYRGLSGQWAELDALLADRYQLARVLIGPVSAIQ